VWSPKEEGGVISAMEMKMQAHTTTKTEMEMKDNNYLLYYSDTKSVNRSASSTQLFTPRMVSIRTITSIGITTITHLCFGRAFLPSFHKPVIFSPTRQLLHSHSNMIMLMSPITSVKAQFLDGLEPNENHDPFSLASKLVSSGMI
jgi:hypothetical protein